MKLALPLTVAAMAAGAQAQTLVSPDSATAQSEFSTAYHIENAIDGTGLPVGFTPADAHDIYRVDNHWTTGGNPGFPTSATFFFNAPQTLGTFYLWNHQSNPSVDFLAADPDYDVTNFSLELFDAADTSLLLLEDLTAQEDIAVAQTFAFPSQVSGVSSVVFTINANAGSNFTGVAEVAFDVAVVPGPGAAVVLGAAGLAAARRRR